MAALLKRGRRIKARGVYSIRNVYVKDGGNVYRVCFDGRRVLLIARKNVHRETLLDPDGRRFRQIAKKGLPLCC